MLLIHMYTYDDRVQSSVLTESTRSGSRVDHVRARLLLRLVVVVPASIIRFERVTRFLSPPHNFGHIN